MIEAPAAAPPPPGPVNDASLPTGSGSLAQATMIADSEWLNWGPLRGRLGSAFIWLLFIVFPVLSAAGKHGPALGRVLVLGAAALFVAAYIALVHMWRARRRARVVRTLFGVLICLATALTSADASGWAFLFVYCAACAALIAPARLGFWAVAMCSALAGATSALAGASGGAVLGFVAPSAGIGLLMLVMRDLRIRNEELCQARAELARLAVARERERFARDLHDLLGHSLSVIALKAELAGRLLPTDADKAASEVADVEQVARTALTEVRDAVSGYRQPTLEGELAGARMALSAAGIQADVHRSPVALDPDVEAVLAWAVREGATNVIRHSRARRCTLTITSSLTDAAVEVIDDGVGSVESVRVSNGRRQGGGVLPGRGVRASADAGFRAPSAVSNGARGLGLEGLAERARALGGRAEAGARREGGFRLAVSLPAPVA